MNGKNTKVLIVSMLIIVFIFLSGCSNQEKSENETETVEPLQSEEQQEKPFPVILVADDGRELPANKKYDGLVCNMKTSFSERRAIIQLDGSSREEEMTMWHMNNICFSIPDDDTQRTRELGVPIFATEIYAEGEREAEKEWHKVAGKDCKEFNEGMAKTRKLVQEGFFQKPLEEFLMRYPELMPKEREYTLKLTGGGQTDREDGCSWWDLNYVLTTKAENGEEVPVASIDITNVFQYDGGAPLDDAHCRIWSAEGGYWRLLEDPSSDLGRNWVSQLPNEDFSSEEKILAYVKEKGAGFDHLLPNGADQNVEWDCHKEQGYWYDYLVWVGTTDTYDLTLAIPIMEKGDGSWYLASRIRKEAVNKEKCQYTLSYMMQTFRSDTYTYTVKKGDNLWNIYSRFAKGYKGQYSFSDFIRYNRVENPNLIYPGLRIKFPWIP